MKEFQPFQKVLVKGDGHDGIWLGDWFSHTIVEGKAVTYCTINDRRVMDESLIVPYEGNEDLLGKNIHLPDNRQRLKEGSHYWCLDDCFHVMEQIDTYGATDTNRFNHFNYFKTKNDAMYVANLIQNFLKGLNFSHPCTLTLTQ